MQYTYSDSEWTTVSENPSLFPARLLHSSCLFPFQPFIILAFLSLLFQTQAQPLSNLFHALLPFPLYFQRPGSPVTGLLLYKNSWDCIQLLLQKSGLKKRDTVNTAEVCRPSMTKYERNASYSLRMDRLFQPINIHSKIS